MLSIIGMEYWIVFLVITFCILLNIGVIVARVFSRSALTYYEIMAAILKILVLLFAGLTATYLHPALSTIIPKWLTDGIVLFTPLINELSADMTPVLVCFTGILILFIMFERKTSLPRWLPYLCAFVLTITYLLLIAANQYRVLLIALVLLFCFKAMDIVDRAYTRE